MLFVITASCDVLHCYLLYINFHTRPCQCPFTYVLITVSTYLKL